jgi:3-oxoacyl-[acyl-carrier protein] reductase
MDVNNLKIIVTGAASGMGRHFSLRLADLGASVFAADIDTDGLESLASEGGERIKTGRCDVTSEEDVTATVGAAYDAMDGLNGLINNAGIFRDGLLVKKDRHTGEIKRMSLRQWQQVIDIDLTGPFLCTREFAAKLIETGTNPGVVINMSSVARYGNRGQSNYSAAKAGLVADTRLWGTELAKFGIRVGAIAPGFVDTPILQGMRPEVLEGMLKAVPLGRVGTPEEIWLGLKFIIECDYFTGYCIDIAGGVAM